MNMNEGKYIFKNKREIFDLEDEMNEYCIKKIKQGFMCFCYYKEALKKYVVETFVSKVSDIES